MNESIITNLMMIIITLLCSLFLLSTTTNASTINTAAFASIRHGHKRQQFKQQFSYPYVKRENIYYERFGVWVS